MKTKVSKPQQQLYLEGLLIGIKSGEPQQNVPFTMSMPDHSKIEIYPNGKGFFIWRKLPDGLWTSCGSEEEINSIFN